MTWMHSDFHCCLHYTDNFSCPGVPGYSLLMSDSLLSLWRENECTSTTENFYFYTTKVAKIWWYWEQKVFWSFFFTWKTKEILKIPNHRNFTVCFVVKGKWWRGACWGLKDTRSVLSQRDGNKDNSTILQHW